MASGKPPSGRYLLIGKNLRSLRECQGLALGTAARRYGRSQGWMSTVENGLTPIRADKLQDLLEFYDCTDLELSKSLIGLADRGRQRDWSRADRDRHSAGTKDYAALETGTSQISSFQPNLIPGLLQTPEYAGSVIRSLSRLRTLDYDALVAFRMRRQRILRGAEPVQLHAVIGEAALRGMIGGADIMARQLGKLIECSSLPNICLQIVPLGAGAHPGVDGAFTILDVGRPGLLGLVLIDSLTRSWYLDDETELSFHREVFELLKQAALGSSESNELIRQLMSEL